MNWKFNNIDNKDIIDSIDQDLLIDRIAFTANMSSEALLNKISKEAILSIVGTILANRNVDIKTVNNISDCIVSPYVLTNAHKAAVEISEFIKNKNNTLYIFADFDVDGIMSGYIFKTAIEEVADCKVNVYYPNREEGYGLSMQFVNTLIANNNMKDIMVVTVDNGITKVDEVDAIVNAGGKVIITDHHTSKEVTPNCTIVDPHNSNEKQDENTKGLCGAGVAFKVAQIVQEINNVYSMCKYLPYLTLATIADVMEFNEENLAIIQYGIEMINSKDCPLFLKAIKAKTNIDILTVNDVQWTIAPMLNACGRMGDIHLATDLVFENKDVVAQTDLVYKMNEDRKKITKKAVAEMSKLDFSDCNVAIWNIESKKYPGGILGILAGKLCELTGKPAIVVTKHNDGTICSGSTRSIDGISMISLYSEMEKQGLILNYGGHDAACACSFEEKKLKEIKEFFNLAIKYEQSDIEPDIEAEEDIEVDLCLTLEFVDAIIVAITQIFPCDSKKFKAPAFIFANNKIVSINQSASNPANGFVDINNSGTKKRIFLLGTFHKLLEILNEDKNACIDILGDIKKSFWNKKMYTINVKDIKKSAI